MTKQARIQAITAAVAHQFKSFGGGRGTSDWNPIANAMRDQSPAFALGVDIAQVVEFVLDRAKGPVSR